ncbi:MAG: polyribonucleotide nucleotidyltransferase [Synergistaceae bacterium]|nr:polyribonucleotide nucleotidyltransferase [Synergistaceae bacterium]
MKQVFELDLYGKKMSFEVGRVAKQANAATLASHGQTTVLVTSVLADKPREGLDFFPLLVDYEEKYYAAGKVPGGFLKREGRATEAAILSGRMVDRSIRSLFPEWMRNDVHVVATVMSVDQKNPPNILAINAASFALAISNIPWDGPIGAVRIGCLDGQLVVNPDEADMPCSTLDLTVAGHKGGVTMVEAGAKEVSEELLVDAMELANEAIRQIVEFIEGVRAEIGKPKAELPLPEVIEEIDNWMEDNLGAEIYAAVAINQKQPRALAIAQAQEKAVTQFAESYPESATYISTKMEEMVKRSVRKLLLVDRVRADGRAQDEIRPITCEIDILPTVHGSALFTRGETQSLGVTTLGMIGLDDQILDGLKLNEPTKRFFLHYNFPPYSVGEVRPMRGPGRREIGHGALAERALRAVMPDEEDFPYVVRQVSDILESNGSSSMASICSGTLAMMAAGVPIKKPVAGIAMGLIAEDGQVCILTDIQGLEDHYGDMDFKVAGTRDGVTALQMDNKAGGITREILTKALAQAKKGRYEILDKIEACIAAPRPEVSPLAPKITILEVPQDKIRDIIGSGGKTIKNIVAETGAKVDIDDNGTVTIGALNQEIADKAIAMIKEIIKEPQVGEIYVGTVVRMLSFGAFIELFSGHDGMMHISDLSTYRVPSLEESLSIGDRVLVEVKEIDDMGRVNLTRRGLIERWDELAANPDFAEAVATEREREERYAAFKCPEKRPEKQDKPKPRREHREKEDAPRHHTIRRFERKK